ncbi:MAG TPA: hypothetical protein VM534_10980 [Thermoanaerobaculia bacterium]|nr:hypothetical protein [Thermoanaerobaculia bacterium]
MNSSGGAEQYRLLKQIDATMANLLLEKIYALPGAIAETPAETAADEPEEG